MHLLAGRSTHTFLASGADGQPVRTLVYTDAVDRHRKQRQAAYCPILCEIGPEWELNQQSAAGVHQLLASRNPAEYLSL